MPLGGNEVERLYITFDADGRPYVKGLKELNRETTRHGRQMETSWSKYGKAAGMAVAAGMALGTAALVSMGKATVKAAASFEYEMSRIKANANATGAELEALNKTVIQLGKDTAFSAGETAQAANELVKAGLSVQETISALPGMLALASAGELGVAQAAELAANALTMFNLSAGDTGQVADTLALAANRSTTEVDLLAQSLQMAGTVTAQAGLSLQETAAALALLANNGLKGSDAGTSLKQMFMQLMGPSEKARDLMESYSIAAYDANGEMLAMDALLENVARGLQGTTDQERDFALATIFGSDAVRAINILLKEGAGAFRDMTKEVSQAGAAQDIAATKMDNLYGSWEQLKGSVETLAISLGTKMLPQIREFVDELTDIVNEALETGDWGAVGERVGALIGEGIEAATPYVITAAEAGAQGLIAGFGEGFLAPFLDWLTGGSQFKGENAFARWKNYLTDQLAENTEKGVEGGLVQALRDLREKKGIHGLLERDYFGEPDPRDWLTLAKGSGLILDEEAFRFLREQGVDEAALRNYMEDQQRAVKAVMETFQYGAPQSAGGLYAGMGEGMAAAAEAAGLFADSAAGIDEFNDSLSEIPELSEEAQAAIQGLTGSIEGMLDDQSILNELLKDGKIDLQEYLAEVQKLLDAELNWEANLRTLAARFPEYTAEVIRAASERGPEFVAALVGANDEDARKALSSLQTIMDRTSPGYIEQIWREIGILSGDAAGESATGAAGAYSKAFWKELTAKMGGGYQGWLKAISYMGLAPFSGYGRAAGGATAEEILKTFMLQQGKVGGLATSTGNVWTTLKAIYPFARWMGGYATSGHIRNSDHYTGHAFDVGGTSAQMQAIANALVRNFESWGLKYIIYNRQAYRGYGWVPYRGSNPHTDHVHVSTYAGGGWIPEPKPSTGQPVPIMAHAGEYVLTQNQAEALFKNAPSFASGGWVPPESMWPSYLSREDARLSMQMAQAGDWIDMGELVTLTETLTRQISFLDQAVTEARATLAKAKESGTQQQINDAAEALFNVEQGAADARRELEALARTPLEQAASRWSNAIGQFQTMMSLLGNSSNALSLQTALLPSLLGSMGGSYQSSLDLMNASTNPQDIMGYASNAINTLSSMFSTEQSVVNRALSDRLTSIDSAERAWATSWDAQASALEQSISRQEDALNEQMESLTRAQREELQGLQDHYDDKLRLLQDSERAITREQQRNRETRALGSLEDELRILQGQGYYTESDIARMRDLETQIQEQRDGMAQQEAAWQREDERTRLERERDEAVKSLQQQQEMERIALQDQIEAARRQLEAQRQAFEQERQAQQRHFEQQREQARQAAQREIDSLVLKYQQMMQTVIDQQNALLSQAGNYQNAGYTLGQQFAQGLIDALPLIQAAAQAAAQTAANYLQLASPAKMGPLHYLDQWLAPFPEMLVRPLYATDLSRPSMDTASAVRGFGGEEHIYVHLDGNAIGLDVNDLADRVSDRIKRKVTVGQWSHGS